MRQDHPPPPPLPAAVLQINTPEGEGKGGARLSPSPLALGVVECHVHVPLVGRLAANDARLRAALCSSQCGGQQAQLSDIYKGFQAAFESCCAASLAS